MHTSRFLHKLLSNTMHKKRLRTLIVLVESLLNWKKLSVTELGRGIDLPIQERSGIRRADRFLGNEEVEKESNGIYLEQLNCLLGKARRPKLIVDWSHIPNTRYYLLRAALVTKGRALTIYEEVHTEKRFGKCCVEKKFLQKMKEMLPSDCKAIVLTDAGFRNPWFKSVEACGWDYVGRIRGTHTYYDGKRWASCKALLGKATAVARCVGKVELCRSTPVMGYLYLLKEPLKGRVSLNRYAKKKQHKDDINYRRSAREGWLLISSLPGTSAVKIKRVIKLYKMRMQIEEGFRDLKSPKYGFGFRYAHSRNRKRIAILLLIAMLAALVAWLVGYIAENNKWHYQFQVNSIKKKRVLSLFFLGCQVIRRKLRITMDEFNVAIHAISRFAI